MGYTAIVIGATGLVGKHTVNELLQRTEYEKVTVFARRSLGISNLKLDEHIVDFDKIDDWKAEIKGDHLFSAMGTTLKKAGGKEQQFKIDYTYQFEVAKAAAENGVGKLMLVSSMGADEKSKFFYTNMKGQLDRDVKQLPFSVVNIFKPSVLVGERQENRFAEKLATRITYFFTSFIFKKYRPIKGETVALGMINVALAVSANNKVNVYELDEIFDVAQ